MSREINGCEVFHTNNQILPETEVMLIKISSPKKIFPACFVMLTFLQNFPRRTKVLLYLNLLLEWQRYA